MGADPLRCHDVPFRSLPGSSARWLERWFCQAGSRFGMINSYDPRLCSPLPCLILVSDSAGQVGLCLCGGSGAGLGHAGVCDLLHLPVSDAAIRGAHLGCVASVLKIVVPSLVPLSLLTGWLVLILTYPPSPPPSPLFAVYEWIALAVLMVGIFTYRFDEVSVVVRRSCGGSRSGDTDAADGTSAENRPKTGASGSRRPQRSGTPPALS